MPISRTALLTITAASAASVFAQRAPVDAPARPAGDPCRAALPGPQSPFTEETAARGVSYFVGNPANNFGTSGMGAASFADLDNDGDADLICVGAWDGRVGIYENDGTGHFTERPEAVPPAFDAGGVIAGDYDGDKDLDLFISCYRNDDVLLRNEGNFVFTDVTEVSGVGGSLGSGAGSAWADIDGDSDLDLYVANRTFSTIDGVPSDDPNRLFINQGDGTFIDRATELGLIHGEEPTLVGAFFDFDLDGDPDLYEGNDKGSGCFARTNYLYENVGGTFVDITEQSGTESCTDTMGIGIADYDQNGWPDLYCTHTAAAPGNTLMMNRGDGTFALRAPEYGVDSLALSWGCAFFDHDNDGDLAIYVNNIFAPDRLFDIQDGWPAVDIAPQMGVHSTGRAYNISLADIDLDGDLDYIIQLVPGDVKLYINHEGSKRHWIGLDITGYARNHYAIGAIVRVRTGETWQTAEVLAGGNNFRSQNELTRHFGLDGRCSVDEIEVRWPDGITRTLRDYPADARYPIYRFQALGDADGDGFIGARDLSALAGSFGIVRADTAVFDMNGDGRIDQRDFRRAVERAFSPVAP